LPSELYPELNKIAPLTPDVPAWAVARTRAPLDDANPKPDVMVTRPPVDMDDSPADITTSPPIPLLPDPTVMYNDPPRPDRAVPVPRESIPLSPELE